MANDIITIPARCGKAARLAHGQRVSVINTHGQQVVDTWAFNADDLAEAMSMAHSRVGFMRLRPAVGDTFMTNRRRPILSLVEDSSGGAHDTLMAACDNARYGLLGCTEYHDNCTDNLAASLAELGLAPPETPNPLNLFMNIPWTEAGQLAWDEPVCKPGSHVVLRAEMDVVIAFSACPQDILPVNGRARTPTEAHFRIL